MSEDATFMPAVLGINTDLSQTPTEDHKALVIRLELGYVEYAALENLHQIAIEALQRRKTELRELLTSVMEGRSELPAPMSTRDLERAIADADIEHREALRLVEKVKRPPPRGVR